MSGIFGTYRRDDQPVDCQLWQRLGSLTSHRGPDGTDIWHRDHVLLGHNALHTTAESLQEKLPHHDHTANLTITADARIDNRDELLHSLGLNTQKQIPDSAIILAAYQKWGEECVNRLLGDFSFVIWDSGENQLFCARDHLGVKPFYYFLSERLFAFSSEIRTLVMHPDIPTAPNEGVIGEYLAAKFISKTETVFREIQRLAPAHCMFITPRKVRVWRYWQPDFRKRLTYRNENDYVEHFQEIFALAINCRLRSHLPVSFELSGGLDSSSIVCMAHSMASAEQKSTFRVHSLIYPGFDCNEDNYIKSVEKHLGIRVQYIDASQPRLPDWQQQIRDRFILPEPPNLSNSEPLLENVQKDNSRVLLSGIGGDEWFTGSEHIYLDLLLKKDFSGFFSNFAKNFQEDRKNTCKWMIASLLWPLLPFPVRKICVQKRMNKAPLYPPWISRDFAKKIDLTARILAGNPLAYVTDLAQAHCFGLFHTGYESMVLENNDLQKARYQIEVRHPFLDRRVIDFALSIPNSLHFHNGNRKNLLRLSGKSYLPSLVRNRSSKAEFSQLYGLAFSTQSFAQAFQCLETISCWIDQQSCQGAYEKNQQSFQKNPAGPHFYTQHIWFAFAISAWYDKITLLE